MGEQRLDIEQRTVQRLSQQQVRFVRMLEMNAPELDEAVEREMEANPALVDSEEEVPAEPSFHSGWVPRESSTWDDGSLRTPDTSASLYDYLNEQLSERDLDADTDRMARYIVGNLDRNGYLTRSIHDIVDDLAFGPGIIVDEATAERGLAAVRSLEPAGVGAMDLRDTLRLQLERMAASPLRDNALRIVTDAFEAFTMKHKHRIISALKLSEKDVDEALALILSLNPKPGAAIGSAAADSANVIVPDFILDNEDGNLSITLNNRIPELKVEYSFAQAMRELEKLPRGKRPKGSEFIVSSFNDARDFIRIVAQRQKTMMSVMSAILKIQEEYFRTEDVYTLKPMMLKNISDLTGLDFSVISRATNNKYLQTPWGVFPLRFFFSDSIGEDKEGGDAATNRKIEAAIAAMVEKEDKRKPLSDRRITENLAAMGFDLSRRTVAKYRDRQNIPVARLRKEL